MSPAKPMNDYRRHFILMEIFDSEDQITKRRLLQLDFKGR